MRFEFKLPDLAEGMIEGEVVSWLVGVGDTIKPEQPVAEVMTDKATVVIPAPHPGQVIELSYAEGDIATVGTTLFVLEVAGNVEASNAASSVAAGLPQAQMQTSPAESEPASRETVRHGATVPPVSTAPRIPRGAGKALATPATRRLAREMGIDIGVVVGSGPHNRVTKDDVRGHAVASAGVPGAAAPRPRRVSAPTAQHIPASMPATVAQSYAYTPSHATVGQESEERIKLRGLRRVIHDTMARSMSTAAHFTYVDEVDCENLVKARQRLKPAAEARGVRLSYLPFIAKATLLALRRHPKVNAVMDDEAGEIVLKKHYHLGVAAATPAGLVVPVVRHADQLTLLDLAGHIQDLGAKSRDNRLTPQELSGSTFTISSLGKLGGLLATPIINHPEVAILGIHNMTKRAVVRGDAIVARQMMNISLSFDHRIIDGHEGAAFAQTIKVYLEDPELMMLEMA